MRGGWWGILAFEIINKTAGDEPAVLFNFAVMYRSCKYYHNYVKIHYPVFVGNFTIDLLFDIWYNFGNVRKEQIMETVATSKGQVVIPSKVRRQLGIKEGTYLQIDVDEANKRLILTPVTREYVHSLRGKYKGRGLMKAFMADKKREKEL